MTLQLFPELESKALRRILVQDTRLQGSEDIYLDVAKVLEQLGIVSTRKRTYTHCVNHNDPDYHSLPYEARDCEGEIEINHSVCPECGRQIDDQTHKEQYEVTYVQLDYTGIVNYVEKALGELDNVSSVMRKSDTAFSLGLVNGRKLEVVLLAPQTPLPDRFSGLYFSETPNLYIYVSSFEQPRTNIVNQQMVCWLGSFLSQPSGDLETMIDLAAVTFDPGSYQNYEKASQAFDDYINTVSWQDFEQIFVPELLQRIARQPQTLSSYLERLQRLRRSVLGAFPVALGGAGNTDLRLIDKFEYMNAAFDARNIADAKNYTGKNTLSSNDVVGISHHLLNIPVSQRRSAIVFVTSSVAPSAWVNILNLRDSNDYWMIIPIPKYLIVELIAVFNCFDLIEISKNEQSSKST
jgi:hypothetical protein